MLLLYICLSLIFCFSFALLRKTFCSGLENNFIWPKIAVLVATKGLEMSPGRLKTRPGLVYLKTVGVGPLSCEENDFSCHKNCSNCVAFLLALAKTQLLVAALHCTLTNVLFDSYFYLYIKPILCRCSFSF